MPHLILRGGINSWIKPTASPQATMRWPAEQQILGGFAPHLRFRHAQVNPANYDDDWMRKLAVWQTLFCTRLNFLSVAHFPDWSLSALQSRPFQTTHLAVRWQETNIGAQDTKHTFLSCEFVSQQNTTYKCSWSWLPAAPLFLDEISTPPSVS